MKDGQRTAIRITDQLIKKEHVQYEIEIDVGHETIHYSARYSELHKLFAQKSKSSCFFPRKHRVYSFLASVVSGQTSMTFKQDRLESLKRYFEQISKTEILEEVPGFQDLLQKAKQSQKNVLRQKPIKGRSLAQFVDGLKNEPSYILA